MRSLPHLVGRAPVIHWLTVPPAWA